jgi:cytochrome c-type biogenesis protein CcmF
MLEYLSHLYLPGALTVWCAVFFGVATFWGYTQTLRGDQSALLFARRGYFFFTLSIVLCAAILLFSLYRRDFRIEYVQQYSGLDLPFHFQLAAFWAGQKGSFLIWLVWGALLGIPLSRSAGKDEPTVMYVYLLTLFGLLLILVRENPFVMLSEAPVDGTGLNPLLQDDWMVIHPPVMFIGYAAAAIPFSFAVAAMWTGDTRRWAARAFPWTLGGFLVLGTAILMGGYWAYKTLGGGGYWGWDPVENASLVPWLIGIVLIHGLYLERTRGRFRRLNLVIACLMYLSVLYGTFLTRSGVLADFSVHSFVDLGISGLLILQMSFFLVLSVGLLALRLPKVQTRENVDVLFSRGFFLVLSTTVVTISAVAIAVGTSAPILTGFMEHQAQVGPEWYNTVNLPLAILTSLLLALIPFLTWKGTPPSILLKKLVPSSAFGLLATAVGAASGVADPFHILFVFLAATALAANLQKAIEKTRGAGGLRSAGGYLAHVGVGMMFLGFLSSSAYDFTQKVTLEQGVPQAMGDHTLTFIRFVPGEGRQKDSMEVEVIRPDSSTFKIYPKIFINERTRQPMVNPDIKTTLLEDFYVSPINYEPNMETLQMAQGETATVHGREIRFVDFELAENSNPLAQLAKGGPVKIGANLEIRRGDEVETARPVYHFTGQGQVETPMGPLPGGGWMAMTGILPGLGRIQLCVAQPRLSIDVTRKPLINLVWFGLYVILFGGFLSTFARLRAARTLDKLGLG